MPSTLLACLSPPIPSLPSCSYMPSPPNTVPNYSSCGEPTSSHYTGDMVPRYDPLPQVPTPGFQMMLPPYCLDSGFKGAPGGHNAFVVDNKMILEGEEAHKRGDYEGVLKILGSHMFDKSHHEQLQHLWLAAVYARESAIKRKKLTAVDRYRLRKRNPFPSSIWEGEKTIYCLKKSARDELTYFFEKNPYPTPGEKRRLANSCELSYVQISNWFKNKRMREKESNRLK